MSFLLLGGCLVTFHEPLPSNQAAPKALLGKWSSKDAWGEPLKLTISRSGTVSANDVFGFMSREQIALEQQIELLRERLGLRPGSTVHLKPRRITRFDASGTNVADDPAAAI